MELHLHPHGVSAEDVAATICQHLPGPDAAESDELIIGDAPQRVCMRD